MNRIPMSKARAIAQSYQDAVDNGERSEQTFVDVFKGDVYTQTIERTISFTFDRLNKHDVSRVEIVERSVKGTVTRVCLDGVTSITISEDESLLLFDAEPYVLSIEIEDEN